MSAVVCTRLRVSTRPHAVHPTALIPSYFGRSCALKVTLITHTVHPLAREAVWWALGGRIEGCFFRASTAPPTQGLTGAVPRFPGRIASKFGTFYGFMVIEMA